MHDNGRSYEQSFSDALTRRRQWLFIVRALELESDAAFGLRLLAAGLHVGHPMMGANVLEVQERVGVELACARGFLAAARLLR